MKAIYARNAHDEYFTSCKVSGNEIDVVNIAVFDPLLN